MFKAMVIGCGKIAGFFDKSMDGPVYSHARGYFVNPDIEVVDYVDINLEKARKLAKKYNSNKFSENFIEPINTNKPDVVSICTPDNTHFSILKEILLNKTVPLVIFVEKPACLEANQLSYLRGLSKRRNAVIVVNNSRRFDCRYKKLRKLIKANKFGGLIRVDVFYYGGWWHNGTHVIDALLFLFEDSLKVTNIGGYINTQHRNDPTLDVSLSFKSTGSEVYLHAFDEKYYQIFDFDFKFEKARLKIDNFENRYIFEKKVVNSLNESILVQGRLNLGNANFTPMENAIRAITKYLKTKNPVFLDEYTVDKSENVVEVLSAAKKLYEAELIK